jgi:predicted NUDIX family phosphoesterase
MAGPMDERVLGLPTERLRSAGLFQGFRPFDSDFFAFLLDPAHLEYRARSEAEMDSSFKQLIPYCVLRHGDRIFHYRRGKSGAEARLRSLRSVGIGGHISAVEDGGAADPYRAGMLRELAEEVELLTPFRERIFGMINDDATPVGTVHLGVVHLLDLEAPDVRPSEDGIAEAGFAPLSELQRDTLEFESWSQLVFAGLLAESDSGSER